MKNIGVLDKGIRLFGGTVCGIYSITREPRSALNTLLLLGALFLVITALAATCPLYSAFGWNTREKD